MYRMLVLCVLAALAGSVLLLAGCSNHSSVGDYFLGLDPQGFTIQAGGEKQLNPTVLLEGAPVENPVVSWKVTGDIGAISATGLFAATKAVTSEAPKTGTIELTGYGQTVSIPVTVTVGPVAQVEIVVPQGVNLQQVPAGTVLAFTAYGRDQYGNRGAARIAITPTWKVEGGIGVINANGEFQARAAGTGKVIAQVGDIADEVTITVVKGEVTHLVVEAPSNVPVANLAVGDRFTCHALTADAYDNRLAQRQPVSGATWSVEGNIGTIAGDGVFTATKQGQGKIIAVLNGLRGELPVVVTGLFHGELVFLKQDMYSNLASITSGGSVRNITTGINVIGSPTVTADGGRLAFTAQGGDLTGICTMALPNGSPQRISNVMGQDLAWSPDGRQIAFAKGLGGAGEICVISTSGVQTQAIAVGVLGTPRHPVWSPDGTKIAFSVEMGTELVNGIYLVNADGSGSTTRIYQGAVSDLCWGPDAGRLLFASGNAVYSISVMGGAADKLFDESNQIRGGIALAANGTMLAYGLQEGLTTQLYCRELLTGNKVQLTNFNGASAVNPVWTI